LKLIVALLTGGRSEEKSEESEEKSEGSEESEEGGTVWDAIATR
jgi:hypothetical protein